METVPALTTLASKIKAKHLECQAAEERSDALWLERSALLIQAKAIVPHGQWITWLKDECGLSARQGQYYLSVSNTNLRDAHLADRVESNSKHRLKTKEERQAQATASADAFRLEQEEPANLEAEEAEFKESDSRQELANKLVEAGYRTLAKQLHPDVGGTHEEMTRLTNVRNTILSLIRGAL